MSGKTGNAMRQLKIKISTAGGGTPFMRQAPHGEPRWDTCEFFINKEIDECDLWVVYGGLDKIEQVRCTHTLFVTNEPPSVKRYSQTFLRQFDTVISCKQTLNHPRVVFNQQALPWWVGHNTRDDSKNTKTYDELQSISSISKPKLISVITSDKTFTKGHRDRLAFVKRLQKECGNDIDVYGIDKDVDDKWDAIAPYKYHIVIENTAIDDYWTEKLADAFLGLSFPIYYGCPNIGAYFPADSCIAIDIQKPDEAIATIKQIISSDQYERSISALQRAKDLILNHYQLFPMIATYANKHIHSREKTVTTLAPESESSIVKGIKRLYHYVKGR